MSKLAEFFKETHTSMGIFYPLHCIIAVFSSLEAAREVLQRLRHAGFAEDEAIAVEGSQFIDLEKEETNLGSFLMQAFSRFLATEQISTDHNLEFAHRGAAFVVVHCPNEKMKRKAWDLMKQLAPLAAHYYDKASVDHLAGGFSTD